MGMPNAPEQTLAPDLRSAACFRRASAEIASANLQGLKISLPLPGGKELARARLA